MSILDTIKNKYNEFIKSEKEYEAICNRKKEIKQHCVERQQQYMKICNICGGGDFFQSKGLLSYHHMSIYENTIKINMITDADTFPAGGTYKIFTKICRQCGNIISYVPFEDIDKMFFSDEDNNAN